MPYAQEVTQNLPFLRRYARALTGRQSAGDACVAAALEALVQDPGLLGRAQSLRVALYRLFTQTWSQRAGSAEAAGVQACNAERQGPAEPPEARVPAERHLTHLTPLPRQAFLLMSLEGFSEEETAEILGTDVATVHELVDAAGRELAAEIATDILIIEDETLVALGLEDLVERLGHRVIGVARTHASAVSLAKAHPPGLVLADIQLADNSSGLDAVNELLRTNETPVIFITAFPERFLTGERPEPAFLIAKPFQTKTVSAVVSQALFFERKAKGSPRRATA